ncbi:hypothetical protein FOMG_07472 [Fusarium oxysporum f. sp. melonis 26406]|uniref:F-box domain-containing protein n=1 Tax=Fusarium oxysporum f. sp. melonis 26406 TaxID=1089452 RepID=X0AAM4_FUSOX|nr:hypothetical protein FOMG_07472 [Fusarium oxysporum f. sp. melonis 26406]
MADCHILRLPDEIHVAVAKLLPGSAIKSIRATCTKLNGIASPFLYPVLYLSCHQLDLDVFQRVASNPLLISGVKELVIDDTTLSPRLANWEVYRTVASYPHLWPERVGDGDPDEDFWTLYKSVLHGHHENRRSHADINALKNALPLLKSLRSLVVTNRTADECFDSGAQSDESSSPVVKMWWRLAASKKEWPPFPPKCDWVTPWNEHEAEDGEDPMHMDWLHDELDRQINKYGLPPANREFHMTLDPDRQFMRTGNRMSYQEAHSASSLDWSDSNWLEEKEEEDSGSFYRSLGRDVRAISIALEVLGDPRIRLTEFRVDASLEVDTTIDTYQPLHLPGLSILLFDSDNWPLLPKLISSFSTCNLTKFHLVLGNYTDKGYTSYVGEGIMNQGNVSAILASMPRLEDLFLEPHGMQIFSAIPADITYKRLRRVEFSCAEIDPPELVSFIQRHASTLKTLSIQCCFIHPYFHDETWEDVMREIRTLQDAGTLKIHDGEVFSAYEHAPLQGCWKNNTLDLDVTGSSIYNWEFECFSTWKEDHKYSW